MDREANPKAAAITECEDTVLQGSCVLSLMEQFIPKNSNIPLLNEVIKAEVDAKSKKSIKTADSKTTQAVKKPQPTLSRQTVKQDRPYIPSNAPVDLGQDAVKKALAKKKQNEKKKVSQAALKFNARLEQLEQHYQNSETLTPWYRTPIALSAIFGFVVSTLLLCGFLIHSHQKEMQQQRQHELKLFFLNELSEKEGRIENRLLALELLAEMEGNRRIRAWAQTELERIQLDEENLLKRMADSNWVLQVEQFEWPIDRKGLTSQSISYENYRRGIKINGTLGDPVLAAEDGIVVYSDKGIKGYGNMILVRHSEELMTVYAHNYANYVREGDKVKRGQMLGVVGEIPGEDQAALYFEVRYQGMAEDPFNYLKL